MALAAFAAAATPAVTHHARRTRWLWLATTVLSGASSLALLNPPAQAQDRDAP